MESKSTGLFGTSDDDSRHSTGLTKKNPSKSSISNSDDEPEILSSTLKSKTKSKLSSPVKRDSSKHLSDSVDRILPKQKKKLIESESSDSEKERSQKQKLQSKSKPETASDDDSETETVKSKSNKSSKLQKSESPKKHRKSAANSHTKESRDIDNLLSESDEGA